MSNSWKSNALGLIGIAASLLSLINAQYREIAAVIFIGAIVFYIINNFSNDLETYAERIDRLENNLDIHKQIVELKNEIRILKGGKN